MKNIIIIIIKYNNINNSDGFNYNNNNYIIK